MPNSTVAAEVVQTAAGHSISAGIWSVFAAVCVGLVAAFGYWIRGMPERRRAANEGMSVEDAATAKLIEGLTAEMARLQARVEGQEKRITALETEVREGHDREAVLKADNLRLTAILDARGEIRQRAQQVVAADRLARTEREEIGE